MFYAVDAQGFHGRNGEFVMKEFALVGGTSPKITRYHLHAPYPLNELPQFRKKTVQYVRERLHGLQWEGGLVSMKSARTLIRAQVKQDAYYYCKGKDKAKFLSDFMGVPVHNISDMLSEEDYRCFYVYENDYSEDCITHKCLDPYYQCAVKNVRMLHKSLTDFFSPQSKGICFSVFDMRYIDSRLDSFRELTSPLAASSVTAYLAQIGYYCKDGSIHCYYCRACSSDWQHEGEVNPFSIPHFHDKCHEYIGNI